MVLLSVAVGAFSFKTPTGTKLPELFQYAFLNWHSSYKIDVEFSMPTYRGVLEKTFCEGLRLKEAAKLSWRLFICSIAERFNDVRSA